jgi:acyl-CoA thioester hydrolase
MYEQLAGFPVSVTIPVQWGEQDPFGHVNNIMYFRWCETARIVYFQQAGLMEMFAKENVGPILAHIGCNFRAPVTYPDTVHVGARVSKIGRTSIRMEHRIVSDALGLAADADSTIVVYDYSAGKSHPVPEVIREAIGRLEGEKIEL